MIDLKRPPDRLKKTFSDRIRWCLFSGYTVFLYYLFVLPPDRLPDFLFRVNDKIMHGLDFLILALLAFRAFFYSSQALFSNRATWKAAGFSLLYGAFLEWVQQTVPGRKSSLADWIADALGVIVACGVIQVSGVTENLHKKP